MAPFRQSRRTPRTGRQHSTLYDQTTHASHKLVECDSVGAVKRGSTDPTTVLGVDILEVVLALQQLDQLRVDRVPKLAQSVVKLASVNRSRVVTVEILEAAGPVTDIVEQLGELVVHDRAAAVLVEHGHQQLDGADVS